MEILQRKLDELVRRLQNAEEFHAQLEDLKSVYPFSEFEYIISHLLAAHRLTLEEYYELRNDYIQRNLYLYLFEISAPRGFGETWAQGHLKALVPSLQAPSKKLDPEYSGQYDFILQPRIRIEVKASRAVAFQTDEPLYIKVLASTSKTTFDMNFQQIKPACCDVFVWLAAWRDVVKCWVIPSHDVVNHPDYSKGQHRGNVGEGQLHLNQGNIAAFDKYLCVSDRPEEAIRRAFDTEQRLRYPARQI